MRICIQTIADVDRRVKNGKVIYESDEITVKWIHLWDTLFKNSSFSYSKKPFSECHERIVNNETDFTSEWYLPSSNETSYFVPVPNMPQIISMMAGYDVADIRTDKVGSALSSYRILSKGVFFMTLISLMILSALVVCRHLFKHHRRLQVLFMRQIIDDGCHLEDIMARKRRLTSKNNVRHVFCKLIPSFLRGSYNGSRWTSLLLTILHFYLVLFFCSVHSTSSIILTYPDIVDTYEKLANHDTAIAIFIDFMLNTSRIFENSPENSLKGQIWRNHFIGEETKKKYGEIQRIFYFLKEQHSVFIASSTFIDAFKSLICSISPEDEMRYLKVFVDPEERENLYGFPVAIHLKTQREVTLKLRLFEESGCFMALIDRFSRHYYERAKYLTGTSDSHIFKQSLVCDDLLKADVGIPGPVGISYWLSLLCSILGVHVLIVLVLSAEKCFAIKKRSVRG